MEEGTPKVLSYRVLKAFGTWGPKLMALPPPLSMSYKFCPRSLRGVSAQSWESTDPYQASESVKFCLKAVPGLSEHFPDGSLKVTEMMGKHTETSAVLGESEKF